MTLALPKQLGFLPSSRIEVTMPSLSTCRCVTGVTAIAFTVVTTLVAGAAPADPDHFVLHLGVPAAQCATVKPSVTFEHRPVAATTVKPAPNGRGCIIDGTTSGAPASANAGDYEVLVAGAPVVFQVESGESSAAPKRPSTPLSPPKMPSFPVISFAKHYDYELTYDVPQSVRGADEAKARATPPSSPMPETRRELGLACARSTVAVTYLGKPLRTVVTVNTDGDVVSERSDDACIANVTTQGSASDPLRDFVLTVGGERTPFKVKTFKAID